MAEPSLIIATFTRFESLMIKIIADLKQVRFQMIFCAKGWVRVVYEDQGKFKPIQSDLNQIFNLWLILKGDSFIMNAGDCVLQPPRIRHRVLEWYIETLFLICKINLNALRIIVVRDSRWLR